MVKKFGLGAGEKTTDMQRCGVENRHLHASLRVEKLQMRGPIRTIIFYLCQSVSSRTRVTQRGDEQQASST